MNPFPQPLASIAAPLDTGKLRDNVDTDAIIPSCEMRSTGRNGLADGLFAPWRYLNADARTENPDFVLNQPAYRNAKILVSGANFGCGSSREHAVWALAEYGIKVVIAESFAPIFYGNCIRNFLLPITLERSVIKTLSEREITVDLSVQTVSRDGAKHPFEIDAEAKQMLAQGLDAIDLTLTQAHAIAGWTARDKKLRPWVYLEQTK